MKMPNFTRADLIKAVADVTGLSKADTESVIAADPVLRGRLKELARARR